ncbi:hypothetical protein HTZ85_00305 [Escherichia coli]|nr:hypothetical protein [Escherichia coli]
MAPAGEAGTGLEFNCHRYSTGDGLRFTSPGRIVGQYFGWRMTFFAIGIGALIDPFCA